MRTQFRVWVFYDQKNKKESEPLSLVQAQIFILSIKAKDFEHYLMWTPGWKGWVNLEEFLQTEQKFFTKLKAPAPKKNKKVKQSDIELPQGGENLLELTNMISEESITDSHFDKTITGKTHPGEDRSGETKIGRTITGQTQHGKRPRTEKQELTEVKMKEESSLDPVSEYWHPEFSIVDVEKHAQGSRASDLKFERERRSSVRYDLMIEILIISSKGRTFRCHTQNISKSGILLTEPLPKEYVRDFFDMVMINKFEQDPRKSRLLIRCKTVGDLSDPRRLSFVAPTEDAIARLLVFIEIYLQKTKELKSS